MKIFTVVYLGLLVVGLSACNSNNKGPTSYDSPAYSSSSQQGRVTDIQVLSAQTRTSGGGALLGAVLGGVVGHQLGSGSGKDIATGVGVVGGALAGNEVEKSNKAEDEIYRVTVRLDAGHTQSFDYQQINNLRVGDRVKIENQQIVRI